MDFEQRVKEYLDSLILDWQQERNLLASRCAGAINKWFAHAWARMPDEDWRPGFDEVVEELDGEGIKITPESKQEFIEWLSQRERAMVERRRRADATPTAAQHVDEKRPLPEAALPNSPLLSPELREEFRWSGRTGPFAHVLRRLRGVPGSALEPNQRRHLLVVGSQIAEYEKKRLGLSKNETSELEGYMQRVLDTRGSADWPPQVPDWWRTKNYADWKAAEESAKGPFISATEPGWERRADRREKLQHPESVPFVEYEKLLTEERQEEQASYYQGWGFWSRTYDRFMNPAWQGLGNMDDIAMAMGGFAPTPAAPSGTFNLPGIGGTTRPAAAAPPEPGPTKTASGAQDVGPQQGGKPDYDPANVAGPNPNALKQRAVSRRTSGEGGVYLKPEAG